MYRNFYYSIFIWSSTCFGRHTAHHREPKTALAFSGFSYLVGCWTSYVEGFWTTRPTAFHLWKTRGCQCNFRLLAMGGVSPETCSASYKYGIIKTLIHYCILLGFYVRIATLAIWSGNKNSTNCYFRLHIYLRTSKILINNSLYVFDSWGKIVNH